MCRPLLIATILIVNTVQPNFAWAGDPQAPNDAEVRSTVVRGYKGGLPFYTAFHQSWTTRLLLLNASKKIPKLQKHLRLTESQTKHISSLRLSDAGDLPTAIRKTLLDENAAVDEELIDPNFYGFLDDSQRELLDRLALEFDGSAGLCRKSIADRLDLSEKTRKAISSTVVAYREHLYLPYFRYCFAAKLPPDHDFRDCEFSGRYLMLLNQSILQHLSPDERKIHDEWTSHNVPPHSVVEAIRRAAPLPDGLFALATPNGK